MADIPIVRIDDDIYEAYSNRPGSTADEINAALRRQLDTTVIADQPELIAAPVPALVPEPPGLAPAPGTPIIAPVPDPLPRQPGTPPANPANCPHPPGHRFAGICLPCGTRLGDTDDPRPS